MKRLLNLFVILLFTSSFFSCSSVLLIAASYEKSKEKIGRYFEERELAPILTGGERPKIFNENKAAFYENDEEDRAKWVPLTMLGRGQV